MNTGINLFGEKLRQINESLFPEWKGKNIAKICEIAPSLLSRIYSGEYFPGEKSLIKIINNLPINDFQKSEIAEAWLRQKCKEIGISDKVVISKRDTHNLKLPQYLVQDAELEERLEILAAAAVHRKNTRNVVMHITDGIIERANREGSYDFLNTDKDLAVADEIENYNSTKKKK